MEIVINKHDDIIDKDALRRGEKTISYYNAMKYGDCLDNKDYGNSIAICMGDYGLYESLGMIIDNYAYSDKLSKILKTYKKIPHRLFCVLFTFLYFGEDKF